jgi:hypothetical protein
MIVCLIAVAVIDLEAAAMARAGADYFAAQKAPMRISVISCNFLCFQFCL